MVDKLPNDADKYLIGDIDEALDKEEVIPTCSDLFLRIFLAP